MMSWSVIEAIGELLAVAAQTCDADDLSRADGPRLYRQLISVLTAFLTVAIVVHVRRRVSFVGRRFVYIACDARRHLSHPPAVWAAP